MSPGPKEPSRLGTQGGFCQKQAGGLGQKIPGVTSLVAQSLRIHLPVQGTWVQSLVQEDPTCHGATKPMCHNY